MNTNLKYLIAFVANSLYVASLIAVMVAGKPVHLDTSNVETELTGNMHFFDEVHIVADGSFDDLPIVERAMLAADLQLELTDAEQAALDGYDVIIFTEEDVAELTADDESNDDPIQVGDVFYSVPMDQVALVQ